MERTKVSSALKLTIFTSSFAFFFSGCASLDRSGPSGYAFRNSEMRQATVESDRRQYERDAAQSELGGLSSQNTLAYRQMLKRQEKMLEGKSEREQYYKAKPYLKTDADRLQFLKIDSTGARDRYLNTKGINGDQIAHPPEMQDLVEQNDIGAGMTRQAVKEAWGAPDDVEVAGNPMYGNEKWKYQEQVTSSEGYMTERRTVFFESGRVVGWETR
jgi:hypothetical protein